MVRSDFRFLQIPTNMTFAAYLQENEVLVLSRGGHLHTFFKPLRVFLNEPSCHTEGHLQVFQTKMTKTRQMPGGGWARLELTEP